MPSWNKAVLIIIFNIIFRRRDAYRPWATLFLYFNGEQPSSSLKRWEKWLMLENPKVQEMSAMELSVDSSKYFDSWIRRFSW